MDKTQDENAKKQIMHPSFVTRLFGSMVDLLILTILVSPFINWLNYIMIFPWFFDAHLVANNVDIGSISFVQKQEILLRLVADQSISYGVFIRYSLVMLLLNLYFIGAYFVFFWVKKSATPGKMILKNKVVDRASLQPLSKGQAIARFIGYLFFPIGIWSILFTKQGIALHDKISGAMVIKS